MRLILLSLFLGLNFPGTPVVDPAAICGTALTVPLLAGQDLPVGQVIVYNNQENLVVQVYMTREGWLLEESHLYIGTLDALPVNPAGNPVPGHFPDKEEFEEPVGAQVFEFKMADLPECPVIAFHAEVKGENNQEESAWAEGQRINAPGNWGMYFEFCKRRCK